MNIDKEIAYLEELYGRKIEPNNNYIFISSESDEIGYALNRAYMPIENSLSILKASDYGNLLDRIAIIMVCIPGDMIKAGSLPERRYISWKGRYADIRLHIDWDTMDKADRHTQELLVAKNIIDSITVIKTRAEKKKVGLEGFDGGKLIDDVLRVIGISLQEINSLSE